MGMAIAVMVVAVRSGRGFGEAPTDQKSCGEERERRARLGYVSQRRVLGYVHILVPQDSIATYVASGTPVPVERLPFGDRMRRKLGSKCFVARLKQLVTGCWQFTSSH